MSRGRAARLWEQASRQKLKLKVRSSCKENQGGPAAATAGRSPVVMQNAPVRPRSGLHSWVFHTSNFCRLVRSQDMVSDDVRTESVDVARAVPRV
jgi:hypothetical protein